MSDEPISLHPEGPIPSPTPPPPSPFSSPRSWMLMVPVIFGTAMLACGGAWLVAVRTTSGVAHGPQVNVTFDSACAAPIIDERLAEYGFPGTWDGPVLHLTLTGAPGEEAVPAALAAPGHLVLEVEGKPVPYTLQNGGMQLSLQGTPVALFTMSKELPDAGLTATLDGTQLEIESVNGNELMLAARAENSTAALRIATDRVVQIKHPLPCVVKVLSVEPVVTSGG